MFVNAGLLAQLKVPSLSPKTKLSQNIGLSIATIEYSRPSKKERKIFGGLLPYGEVWRTGANTATKLSFSKNLLINGEQFKKGDYTLLTVPGKDKWKVKWYKYASTNWNDYKEQSPYKTMEVLVKDLNEVVETFSMRFQNNSLHGSDLYIEWETTRVEISIKIPEELEIVNSINKTLTGPSNGEYFRAALYLHESKTDLPKALEYIQKVTSSEKALFFQVTREALILKDLNEISKAKRVAKRALRLSEKAKNNDFIRINKEILSL